MFFNITPPQKQYFKGYNFTQSIQPNGTLLEPNKSDIDALIIKKNLNKIDVDNYVNKRPLIIHCCHHKTGTVVMEKILRAISVQFGLKYQYCSQQQLEPNTDVWLEHHSHIDFNLIDRPIIGTHMIRNPSAIIVSAYEYHKSTVEPWANRKIKTLENMTYKGILNKLGRDEGLLFEMKNEFYVESSRNTIMDIYNWDYYRPNFLEVKYEDLMNNFNGTLANMFKHYGFSREMIEEGLRIAANYNLRNKRDDELIGNRHVTNKNLDMDKWREYFKSQDMVSKFWKIYPEDLFVKIGYLDQSLPKTIEIIEEKQEEKIEENISRDDIERLISIVADEDNRFEKTPTAKSREKEKIWLMYNGGNVFKLE